MFSGRIGASATLHDGHPGSPSNPYRSGGAVALLRCETPGCPSGGPCFFPPLPADAPPRPSAAPLAGSPGGPDASSLRLSRNFLRRPLYSDAVDVDMFSLS